LTSKGRAVETARRRERPFFMLSDLQRQIIASVQQDIAVTSRPYRQIARELGISEEQLLAELKNLCADGTIRRFGATLRHQKSGFGANAMVAWQVEEGRIDEVGKKMAGFRAVSHCYRRDPTPNWPFNLYTMIHAADEKMCRNTVLRMAEAAQVEIYEILFSRRELKKTSMQYFSSDNDD
jgi:DNA-binding Lrp family transcriptional regulator